MPDLPQQSVLALGLAALLVAPGLRAENSLQSTSQASGCSGPAQALALEPVPGGAIDLQGQSSHFHIGRRLELCASESGVELRGRGILRLSCADLINADEGRGHDFLDRGTAYLLWLHVNPERDPPVLELGLYRDGEQLYWLDTGYPVCTRYP